MQNNEKKDQIKKVTAKQILKKSDRKLKSFTSNLKILLREIDCLQILFFALFEYHLNLILH